jgi:hypothetical protein
MRDIDELIRLVREGDERSAAAFAEDLCDEIERLRGIMATCEWCGPDVGADQPTAVACDHHRAVETWLHCVKCGRDILDKPAPMAADQQSARKGLDELTRMAQEDGLYDGPNQQSPAICRHGVPEDACMACDMDKIVATDKT